MQHPEQQSPQPKQTREALEALKSMQHIENPKAQEERIQAKASTRDELFTLVGEIARTAKSAPADLQKLKQGLSIG
jgi:hypothetical protein